MLSHDACHSIDRPNVCPNWKISSFLNGPTPGKGYQGVAVMTRHSPAFEAERPVPAADTVKDLVPETQKNVSTNATEAPVIRKLNFRKALMAGAAVAVVAGAAWYEPGLRSEAGEPAQGRDRDREDGPQHVS
jgi:hypothetical protein